MKILKMEILKPIGKILLATLGVVLAAAGILYIFAPHPPATPKSRQEITQLENYLQQLVASGAPPAISIAVVKDGEVVYDKAFGMANAPAAQIATPETVYHWWSMTKIVTAIAVLQLQERGLLQLDDPVTTHLPWFAVQYPAATSQQLTLRHLLNHTSGLPDTVPAIIGWVHYDDAGRNQSELAQRHLPSFNKLQFEPGSKAVYSNLNYMLLGAVIEQASGQSYETFVTENILKPLGMQRSGFVYSQEMAAHEAAGTLPVVHFYTPMLPFLFDTGKLIHQQRNGIFWLNRLYVDVTPPTGLIGPAADMARLMLAYLNKGELDGVRVLSPASIDLMSNASHVTGDGPNMAAFPGGQHGLGWYVIPDRGANSEFRGEQSYLQHHGGGPGFASTLRLYPEQGLGIVVLANGTDLDRDGLADRLAEINWSTKEVATRP
jgi:CubicO group peptidase (beta-lactamase class C family)